MLCWLVPCSLFGWNGILGQSIALVFTLPDAFLVSLNLSTKKIYSLLAGLVGRYPYSLLIPFHVFAYQLPFLFSFSQLHHKPRFQFCLYIFTSSWRCSDSHIHKQAFSLLSCHLLFIFLVTFILFFYCNGFNLQFPAFWTSGMLRIIIIFLPVGRGWGA